MSKEHLPGLMVRTFACIDCGVRLKLIVHAHGPKDPYVMDRFRLAAASQRWVIDFDNKPWCSEHRPDDARKRGPHHA